MRLANLDGRAVLLATGTTVLGVATASRAASVPDCPSATTSRTPSPSGRGVTARRGHYAQFTRAPDHPFDRVRPPGAARYGSD